MSSDFKAIVMKIEQIVIPKNDEFGGTMKLINCTFFTNLQFHFMANKSPRT